MLQYVRSHRRDIERVVLGMVKRNSNMMDIQSQHQSARNSRTVKKFNPFRKRRLFC